MIVKKVVLLVMVACLIPCVGFSEPLKIGEKLPTVKIQKSDDAGELVINGDKITYKDFDSTTLTGKVRSVLYIAGRTGASKLNKPYTNKLTDADFKIADYQTVTIVNLNDAMWGTGGLVRSDVKDNKLKFPKQMFILDEDGVGRKIFGFKKESYAVILIDKDGKILAYKDGALTDKEIDEYLNIIKSKI